MFSRPDFRTAVSDVQALLGTGSSGAAEVDEPTRARLAAVRQEVIASEPAGSQHRRWRPAWPARQHRRVIIGVIAVPALVAAMAAGWVIAAAPPPSRVTAAVVCYSLPHLPERGVSESAAGGVGGAVSPTVLCARQWAAGQVVSGVHQVPASLVACANPSLGEVAVFPDTTCAATGLPPLPAGYDKAARRFAALNSALIRGLIGTGTQPRCASAAAALSFTRQTARSHGFGSWRVIPPRHASGPSCWQAQPDPAAHTIQVVPQPGAYPPGVARVAQIIRTTLSVPAGSCRSGNPPENATATASKLRVALRKAGEGIWKIRIRGHASRQLPCYEEVQFPPANHKVVLDPVTFPGTTY
jgi:hypothetical protein